MKVIVDDDKLIKLKKHDSNPNICLTVINSNSENTKITIFVGGVEYQYIYLFNHLLKYRDVLEHNLCIKDSDIFIYFNGPKCPIHDNYSRILYSPDVSN